MLVSVPGKFRILVFSTSSEGKKSGCLILRPYRFVQGPINWTQNIYADLKGRFLTYYLCLLFGFAWKFNSWTETMRWTGGIIFGAQQAGPASSWFQVISGAINDLDWPTLVILFWTKFFVSFVSSRSNIPLDLISGLWLSYTFLDYLVIPLNSYQKFCRYTDFATCPLQTSKL